MEETVVIHPGIGAGHLNPMLELSKLLVSKGFSVAIPLMQLPPPFDFSAAVTDPTISTAFPSITFHRLPPIPPRSSTTPINRASLVFDALRRFNPEFLNFVKSLSLDGRRVRAIILDFFCTDALEVAAELGIPAYFFFSTAAANLLVFVYLSTQNYTVEKIKDLGDGLVKFPGLHSVPATHFPSTMFQSEEAYRETLDHFRRLPDGEGIVVNTFESLEAKAIKAISVEDLGLPMPPVYCVGPLVSRDQVEDSTEKKHACLTWLDEQPKGSVVLLSFGSMGRHTKQQLQHIAEGLERSEQRFIWVVRSPPSDDPEMRFKKLPEPDLDELLPAGFVQRVGNRGMVVKSWAPQTAILGHESTGGFVTHCGWNSTLEAICAGVPMISWPLYAEQFMNKVYLVDEMKLAVEMKGYDKGLVSADEVAEKVRWLMETEGGKELKRRAAAVKEAAVAALMEGGSSHDALMEFVKAIK